MDDLKCASEICFIAVILLSPEYFNPNLPLMRLLTSSLLLLIILHRIMYLKQLMARLSLPALWLGNGLHEGFQGFVEVGVSGFVILVLGVKDTRHQIYLGHC